MGNSPREAENLEFLDKISGGVHNGIKPQSLKQIASSPGDKF